MTPETSQPDKNVEGAGLLCDTCSKGYAFCSCPTAASDEHERTSYIMRTKKQVLDTLKPFVETEGRARIKLRLSSYTAKLVEVYARRNNKSLSATLERLLRTFGGEGQLVMPDRPDYVLLHVTLRQDVVGRLRLRAEIEGREPSEIVEAHLRQVFCIEDGPRINRVHGYHD